MEFLKSLVTKPPYGFNSQLAENGQDDQVFMLLLISGDEGQVS